MFAVPGWAVSASALVQEKTRPKTTSADPSKISTAAKSKKRKRDGTEVKNRVAAHNVAPVEENILNRSTEPTTVLSKNKKSKRSSRLEEDGSGKKPNSDTQFLDQRQSGDAGLQRSGLHINQTKDTERARKVKKQHQGSTRMTKLTLESSDSTLAMTRSLTPLSATKLTPLQAKMRSKLTSARFRHLNETLYTTSSSDALKLFTSSPDLFSEYHAGFAQQVKDSWPQNPVEEYVKLIKSRGALSELSRGFAPLPRRKTGSCTIADLGCGDAPLARGCQSTIKSLQLKFHNYDLHAANTFVTKADISNLPLRDGEADIAIFCLSLMGTNWINFVEEAWRILRGDGKGEVWVAEVKSRFGRVTRGRVVENSVGKKRKKQKLKRTQDGEDEYDGPEKFVNDDKEVDELEDETDISAFIKVFTRRGFQLRDGSVNKRNKMFVSMVFTKSGIPTTGKHKGLKWNGKEYQKQHDGKIRFVGGQNEDEEFAAEEEANVLKPCVYKIR